MEVKMQYGGYQVIDSGSFIYNDTPVTFHLDDLIFVIILHFDKEVNEKNQHLDFVVKENDNLMEIHFYVKEGVVLSSQTPYKVGRYKEGLIYFSFHIDLFPRVMKGDSTVIFNYMWLYEGKK